MQPEGSCRVREGLGGSRRVQEGPGGSERFQKDPGGIQSVLIKKKLCERSQVGQC